MPGENNISFNLLRNFSFLSLICVVVISSVTASVLSRFLEHHMLQGDAQVMKQFIERITRHHDPTGYFSASNESARKAALNDFFRDISHMPDVVRINAYARSRKIIWSNDFEMIGRTFPDNHELDEALAGELAIEADLSAKSEHRSLEKSLTEGRYGLVEIYIPIHDPSNGNVVGVTEIYKVPRTLAHSIRTGQYLVWLCVSLGGAFLYLVLFWIVYRANGLIHLQHHALVKNARFAAIGEMAASVAHSIRNPLAAIRSSAELAEEEPAPATREYARSIMQQVDRLDAWIRELLMFSRAPSDAKTRASLREVIGDSLDGFGDRPARQGIQVEVDLADAGGARRRRTAGPGLQQPGRERHGSHARGRPPDHPRSAGYQLRQAHRDGHGEWHPAGQDPEAVHPPGLA